MPTRLFKTFIHTKFFLLVLAYFSSAAIANQHETWQRIDISKKASLRGSAINGNSLWVSGSKNTVFISQDNGKTWADRSVPANGEPEHLTDFRDIALFDKNTAIVMGAGEGQKSVLYKTINAGKTWQLLNQNTDARGFYNAIAFWNEKKGLLLGDPIDGFYVVKKTIDGGKTWRRIAKLSLPAILEKEAAFAASGNTLITGKNGQAWITTGGFSASVYYSDNFGETWLRQSIPLFNKTQTAGGYALSLNSEQQVFVLGGDYKQRQVRYNNVVTFSQGKWQAVNNGQRGLRTAMACIAKTCVATGKMSSDISYNSGKTWQIFDDVTAPEADQGFYTLASSDRLFLAAGSHGKVAILLIK